MSYLITFVEARRESLFLLNERKKRVFKHSGRQIGRYLAPPKSIHDLQIKPFDRNVASVAVFLLQACEAGYHSLRFPRSVSMADSSIRPQTWPSALSF